MNNCIYMTEQGCAVLQIFCGEWRRPAASVCNLPTCIPLFCKTYQLEPPATGENILKWAKKQVEAGKVVQPKPVKKPCSSCGKLSAIAKGLGRLTLNRIFKREKPDWAVDRLEVCSQCEHRTFLPVTKWAINFIPKGDLPINHEPGDWDALWCAKCKCCLEGKVLVEAEHCPLGHWPAP